MSEKGIRKIECRDAARPAGPYSQAVSAGDYIFVSGQIPLDAKTGNVIDGEIKEQTSLVIDNAEKILNSFGSRLDKVVKVDVFLKDLEDFTAMNEVYSARFNGDVKPARCVVQASKLPKDVRIELSCIAYTK